MDAPELLLAFFAVMGLLLVIFASSVARLLRSLSAIAFKQPSQQWPLAKAMVGLVFEPRRLPFVVRALGVAYVATGMLLFFLIKLLPRLG